MQKILISSCCFLCCFSSFSESVVYPKHPRLLFRDTDLSAIRKKCQTAPYAELYQAMKSWADQTIAEKSDEGDIVVFAFLYQVEGKKKYLEETKRRLLKTSGYKQLFLKPSLKMKYAYDLICNDLDTPTQKKPAQKILGMHMANKYKPDVMGMHQICNEGSSTLAVWGDKGIDMEMLRKRFEKERKAYLGDYFRKSNVIAQRWGGWHRSFECRCWRKYVARFAEIWLNATGENTFDNNLIRGHEISNGHFTKSDSEEWKHSRRIDVQETIPKEKTLFLHVLETFPVKVEDNYKHWKTDPRYKQWMNDKRFRIVISQKTNPIRKDKSK